VRTHLQAKTLIFFSSCKQVTPQRKVGAGMVGRAGWVRGIHLEYAERGRKYDILFIISLFCGYNNLEYVRVPVIYRVNQAE